MNSPTFLTLLWLGLLSMLGFVSTDMYLPAFETLRLNFATSKEMVSLSLSLFLLGMALGQLVYGPLSDRIGRKKVLLSGLGLFCLASILCVLATQIEVFLVGRFLQALGACSATVIWQAIVVDRYQGQQAGRIFATIMPLVALSPALAPLLGAGLESQFGWQSIFIVLVGLGVVMSLMTVRESESADLISEKGNVWQQLGQDYAAILTSKKFIGNVMIFGACSAAFFAYLTGSPFIMTAMGYSGGDIGLSYVPQTIAFIVGGYGCRTLLNHYSGERILPFLLGLFVASVVLMFVMPLMMEIDTIYPILVAFCFLAVANGAVYPIVINFALADFKHCSATAAGLLNFLQTMVCFVASSAVSAFMTFGIMTVTTAMFITGFVVIFGYYLSRQ